MKRKILETIPLIPIIKEDERKGIPIDNEKSRFTKLSNKCESWATNQRKKFPKENTIYFKSFDQTRWVQKILLILTPKPDLPIQL